MDIRRKERDFDNVTLSDTNVVKYLILYRSKVDVSYGASINIDINQAGDTFEFNQQLIALYASLDKVVEQCKFKKKQKELLRLIYEGNTLHDICSMNIGYKRSATYDLFDRMVAKIVKINMKNWRDTMVKLGYIETM